MRLAFFINDPTTNGVAAIALSWIRQLATQYPEDRYLVLSESPLSVFAESLLPEKVSIINVPHRYPFFSFWSDALLYLKLFSFRPDLFVTTYATPRFFARWKQARVSPKGSLVANGVETFFTPFALENFL